jgi:aryl sulfotransferase
MLTFYWEGDLGMLSRKATRVVRDFTCDSRRWAAYKPREGDVIIATAPKVGTTWMQQIVSLLIFQSPEPRQLAKLSPWIDCRFRGPVEQMLDSIQAQTHRRFLKSHLPLDALPIYDEVKYIHVARDGRDECMSMLNHYSSLSQEALESFDKIGLSDETINRPFPRTPKREREFFLYWIADRENESGLQMSDSFFRLERTFWNERGRPNLLLVHYNDLKADLAAEMKRVAEFLNIATPEAIWPQLVEPASFESMKREGGRLMPQLDGLLERGHQNFFYKGTNSRWRSVLNDPDIDLYEQKIKAELSPALIRWLTDGRLVAGDPVTSPD